MADDVLDLGAVAAAHPKRQVRLPLRRMLRDGTIAENDLVRAVQLSGVTLDKLTGELGARNGQLSGEVIEVIYRIAWLIGRRADPALAWETVESDWHVILDAADDQPPDPTRPPTGGATTT